MAQASFYSTLNYEGKRLPVVDKTGCPLHCPGQRLLQHISMVGNKAIKPKLFTFKRVCLLHVALFVGAKYILNRQMQMLNQEQISRVVNKPLSGL